jgi:hypothetical protein
VRLCGLVEIQLCYRGTLVYLYLAIQDRNLEGSTVLSHSHENVKSNISKIFLHFEDISFSTLNHDLVRSGKTLCTYFIRSFFPL